MLVSKLTVANFRCYERAGIELSPGLNIISGSNGIGKTNLLEALYFACSGRSCRTNNEREVVRFGAPLMRLELDLHDSLGEHTISVGFQPGQPKRFGIDGASVERLIDRPDRPLVSVFMPDRLELVVGPPSLRRAHIDQVIAALWPTRRATRQSYAAALAQRNALIAGIRAGRTGQSSLATWNHELARHGMGLMSDRRELVERLKPLFTEHASQLGLDDSPEISYRPRSEAETVDELVTEIEEHTKSDLERGFSSHGPHRDDLTLKRAGRSLRIYGSRGQQRLALLALLLAEREELAATRSKMPLMLLDEAMSELDGSRRLRLVELLMTDGQSLITTTDQNHVPKALDPSVRCFTVERGEDGLSEVSVSRVHHSFQTSVSRGQQQAGIPDSTDVELIELEHEPVETF